MNGYPYNGGYDPNAMEHSGQFDLEEAMMMGQEGMGHGMGGQSLDEIVDQSAKSLQRRQSMPQQYGANRTNAEPDLRRISMMENYGSSPAGAMGNYGFAQGTSMDQSGMMSTSPVHPGHSHPQQRSQSRRQSSSNLNLDPNFSSAAQNFGSMMAPSSNFASPVHPQSGMDLGVNSPLFDPNLGMPMDFSAQQTPQTNMGGDGMSMNLYSQPQFNTSAMSSPMHPLQQQGTPNVQRGSVQDMGPGSGMNTQYGGRSVHSLGPVRALSRSTSLHVQDDRSSVHGGTPMTAGNQHDNNRHGPPGQGFRGQPQHPQPGSSDDRGMGDPRTQEFDGTNGPVPVNPSNYNPNNQGFAWDAPEGGWPSTMVGRPHMQSTYKNAYSSTGFDMLGVLVFDVCS